MRSLQTICSAPHSRATTPQAAVVVASSTATQRLSSGSHLRRLAHILVGFQNFSWHIVEQYLRSLHLAHTSNAFPSSLLLTPQPPHALSLAFFSRSSPRTTPAPAAILLPNILPGLGTFNMLNPLGLGLKSVSLGELAVSMSPLDLKL
jgi:hypothetical protein